MCPQRTRVVPVSTYLVERYWPGVTLGSFEEAERRLATSVAALAEEGSAIRTVAATLVPADEAAYWVVDAPSAELVARAFATAGLPVERIVGAVELRPMRAVGPGRRGVRPPESDATETAALAARGGAATSGGMDR